MKTQHKVTIALGAILVLVLVGAINSFFIVMETEQVVVTQFGKPVGRPITDPGLKFKLPFIQKVTSFDKRYLEWDGDANQIPTEDKRFIWVDSYARWQITDALLFLQRLWDERGAQSRLDDILDGETRNTIAKYALIEVVRSTNREFDASASELPAEEAVRTIHHGRTKLEEEVLRNAAARTKDLGIEILDFRFKRINYEEGVRDEVYSRMVSERKRIADQYRSEGAGEAARIHGDKERELQSITSEAYRTAQEIKGRADAESTDIYAKAFNQDPEFYRFYKSMEVYQSTLDKETTLILGTEGDFLKYLEKLK